MFRFWIFTASGRLIDVAHDPAEATRIAIAECVNTGRTVHVHDRLDELS